MNKIDRIIEKHFANCEILRTWHPMGGVSAQVTGVAIRLRKDEEKQLLVREHPTAKKEYNLLSKLHTLKLPVPKPYGFDDTLTITDLPYIILEYVEGATVFSPADMPHYLLETATLLAKINQTSINNIDFLPHRTMNLNRHPFDELSERILTVISENPRQKINNPVLLHGDLWVGNLLWQDNQLVAVIDWEDAAIGDPLYDLANTRFEMLWAFGENAMQAFTNNYKQLMPLVDYTLLSYHDLYATLKLAPHIDDYADWSEYERTDITPDLIRQRYEWFVNEALKSVSKS